ncbi:hypothetical protein ACMG4P_16765 [Pseudovibrio denitrificans]|uniref:hypothetical protein n=1 Tax=Pseudovibrio denitrificans TaxID=258256 RepID=UPI0039BF2E27
MLRLSVLLFFLGTNVVAACPQEVPESGIKLTRTESYFSVVFKKTAAGLSEERVMMRDGKQEKVTTIYPHALVTGQRTDSRGTLALEYAQPASDVGNLSKSGRWVSDFSMKFGAKEIYRGTAKLTYLDQGKVEIGKCSYDVWRIESRLEFQGRAPTVFDKYYSPKLGLVLRAVKLTPDRETINGIVYDKIEVVHSD